MKTRQWLLATVLLASASPVWACSQIDAFSVFVGDNDRNRDGKLSRKEFIRAKLGDNLIAKFKFNTKTFRQLDRNRNGFIDHRDQEWYEWIEYKRAPCADWEEAMQKYLEEEKQRTNGDLSSPPVRAW